jgi:hypothetical protein
MNLEPQLGPLTSGVRGTRSSGDTIRNSRSSGDTIRNSDSTDGGPAR